MNSEELVRRIMSVLREMSLLSEINAAPLDGDRISHSASQSSAPPGAVLQGRRDLRDLSLATYWDARFKLVKGNERRLLTFLYLAERDLAAAQRRQPMADPHESRAIRERRVLLAYEGMSPLEAALAEGCSESWIRKTRRANRRDSQNGELLLS